MVSQTHSTTFRRSASSRRLRECDLQTRHPVLPTTSNRSRRQLESGSPLHYVPKYSPAKTHYLSKLSNALSSKANALLPGTDKNSSLRLICIQVRLAASVASRKFLLGLSPAERDSFYSELLPPLCLNRLALGRVWRRIRRVGWRCSVEFKLWV